MQPNTPTSVSGVFDWLDETHDALRGFEFMLPSALDSGSPSPEMACNMAALLRRTVADLVPISDMLRAEIAERDEILDALPDVEFHDGSYRLVGDDTREAAFKPSFDVKFTGDACQEFVSPEDRILNAMRRGILEADAQEDRIAEIIRKNALWAAGRMPWHDIDTIAARARVHRDEAARILFVLTGEDHAGAAYRAFDGNPSQGLHAHLLAQAIHATLAQSDVWGRVSKETGIELNKLEWVLTSILTNLPRRADVRGQFAEVDAIAKAEAEAEAFERVAAQDATGPDTESLLAVLNAVTGPKLRTAIDAIAEESGLPAKRIAEVVAQLIDEADEAEETGIEATDAPPAKAERQKGR
ncbi:hypothetical protein PUH89_06530 [Rhodobacter capsulatus]|uniref:Uncharacterized protein n=1 Tax=Rhodobacter capsulatus TaxID=1061 RepID=A0A1G7LQ20_RHOCA|nr:hypothetical protein [Rhodobacter capsulatus]WER10627.1 hypothetical protein PUH89_06530 [Rhodobacter capsulatus]SDF51628.1 hypothetical protein SAMN04244550_02368 [Rhodobacter capsulatus]